MLSVRSKTNSIVLGLLLVLLMAVCADTPPNVLLIVIDDLRVELSAYDKPYMQTPNIDALAEEGVLFENAYANVPVCGASRASLFAGLMPTRERFVGYQARIDEDAPDATPLHSLLENNGYHTESIGKVLHFADDSADGWTVAPWHPQMVVPKDSSTGHRDYQDAENIRRFKDSREGPAFEAADVPDNAYFDGKIADKAIQSLRELGESDRPFFLAVGLLKPHLPFNAPKKYWDLYSKSDIELASNAAFPDGAPKNAWHDWGELRKYDDVPAAPALMPDEQARKLIHGYYAGVSYSDAQVGKLLAELEELGLAENTIVVLIGDHGWSLGEHGLWAKHSPFDVATRTPLIVRAPGRAAHGSAAGLVEFIDIYPTILELLDLPDPGHLQGSSFVAQLEDAGAPGKSAVFPRWHSGDVIKTANYALTEWFNDKGERTASMLYDHRTDRDETRNVVDDKEYAAALNTLRKQLEQSMSNR